MKKKTIISLLLLSLLTALNLGAQEGTTPAEDFSGVYLGTSASTNGWGFAAKYLFNKRITVKAGFETLKLGYDFSFDENDVQYDAKLDFETGSIYLFGDFHYTRNLYFSAGALFNKFNPGISGYAISGIEYGDITIPAEMVGDFKYTVSSGLAISPYGALGARSFIGKHKRVVLNSEIGCYYMGPPEIELEATGLISPTADPAHGQKEKLEHQIEQYRFYPVLKFMFAVKIF